MLQQLEALRADKEQLLVKYTAAQVCVWMSGVCLLTKCHRALTSVQAYKLCAGKGCSWGGRLLLLGTVGAAVQRCVLTHLLLIHVLPCRWRLHSCSGPCSG